MKEDFEEIQVLDFKKPKKTKPKAEASTFPSHSGKPAPKVEEDGKAKVVDHEKRYAQLLKRAVELLNKNNPELGTL